MMSNVITSRPPKRRPPVLPIASDMYMGGLSASFAMLDGAAALRKTTEHAVRTVFLIYIGSGGSASDDEMDRQGD